MTKGFWCCIFAVILKSIYSHKKDNKIWALIAQMKAENRTTKTKKSFSQTVKEESFIQSTFLQEWRGKNTNFSQTGIRKIKITRKKLSTKQSDIWFYYRHKKRLRTKSNKRCKWIRHRQYTEKRRIRTRSNNISDKPSRQRSNVCW